MLKIREQPKRAKKMWTLPVESSALTMRDFKAMILWQLQSEGRAPKVNHLLHLKKKKKKIARIKLKLQLTKSQIKTKLFFSKIKFRKLVSCKARMYIIFMLCVDFKVSFWGMIIRPMTQFGASSPKLLPVANSHNSSIASIGSVFPISTYMFSSKATVSYWFTHATLSLKYLSKYMSSPVWQNLFFFKVVSAGYYLGLWPITGVLAQKLNDFQFLYHPDSPKI